MNVEEVQEIIVLRVSETSLFFPCSALNQIVGYEFQGRDLSLQYCLNNPGIMAPVDYMHLSIKLEDLKGRIIKIHKIYTL